MVCQPQEQEEVMEGKPLSKKQLKQLSEEAAKLNWNEPPRKQIKLRTDLVWQDKKKRVVSINSVIGYLAMWAVRQSPYGYPQGLEKGLKEFRKNYTPPEYQEMTIKQLQIFIAEAIGKSPTIKSWNNPKKGKHTMVFTSRYNTIKPDYDFIDLTALGKNTGHSVWLENMYDDGDK